MSTYTTLNFKGIVKEEHRELWDRLLKRNFSNLPDYLNILDKHINKFRGLFSTDGYFEEFPEEVLPWEKSFPFKWDITTGELWFSTSINKVVDEINCFIGLLVPIYMEKVAWLDFYNEGMWDRDKLVLFNEAYYGRDMFKEIRVLAKNCNKEDNLCETEDWCGILIDGVMYGIAENGGYDKLAVEYRLALNYEIKTMEDFIEVIKLDRFLCNYYL